MEKAAGSIARTVLGDVSVSQLGITLTHEHLFFDFCCYWQKPTEHSHKNIAYSPVDMPILGDLRMDPLGNQDNCLMGDEDTVVEEVIDFRTMGGKTIVDVTLNTIGRDPKGLREVASRTGINIIMGCGAYVQLAHPEGFRELSQDDVAEAIVQEVTVGVGTTGVRAGIIGEIGISYPQMTKDEEKSLRAAAIAQRITGAPLSVHIGGWNRQAFEVLEIIDDAGGDPSRTVICHMNPCYDDQQYQQSVARTGAYLGYDMIGMQYRFPESASSPEKFLQCPSDTESASGILALIEAGFQEHILLSHDHFTKTQLKHYGGGGYAYILRHFLPLLKQRGVTDEIINGILIDNCARFLALATV